MKGFDKYEKKTKNVKTRVGIFKNMGGNIPGGNFPGGNFPDGSFRIYPSY